MTIPMVIDVSMAASWVMPDEGNPSNRQLLDELKARKFLAMTLPLFWYEFCNILVINLRRGRIAEQHPVLFLQEIRSLGLETRPLEDEAQVIPIASRLDLSAYDAAYLTLASKADAILATNDRKLMQTALITGVKCRTALV